MEGDEEQVVDQPRHRRGQCDNEGHRHAHTQRGIGLTRHAKEGTAAVKAREDEVLDQHGSKHHK